MNKKTNDSEEQRLANNVFTIVVKEVKFSDTLNRDRTILDKREITVDDNAR